MQLQATIYFKYTINKVLSVDVFILDYVLFNSLKRKEMFAFSYLIFWEMGY